MFNNRTYNIKLSHIHDDGKECFAMPKGIYTKAGRYCLRGAKQFTIAYRTYTGHYYAFNDSGREIASFSSEFFEEHIAGYKVGDLIPDPDCVVTP